ncbi:MAG: UDP-N-acetylmuramoyl-tripeptide--D-alanyl-D-alanine ligase [Gammaproteobacteria bacterium]|nr:UDP-N-acetylmuramoyl-tripeptide--D-alanyl-D-alanine ligase [Gammaproteobacteria bacterium]
MIGMSLADAAAIVGGQLTGADHGFEGVSTDSRTLAPKQLFYALKGERFDGHDSLPQAADRGAAGAVVTRRMDTALACIHVPDTRRALGDLARAWRLRHHCTVIGVTGSNGKTTTKEMTAAILRQRGPTLATEGNLNNHIGLPLTLFGLSAEHEAAVIEMGANAMNDIAELADIARPDIGIVTMCGPAHLQGFGSVENVALAKGRLFEGIAPEGVAILNVDDPFRDFWLTMCGQRKVLRFGLSAEADFTAHEITEGAPGEGVRFELVCPQGTVTIHLPVDGVHNVRNALAAAAASMAAGATLSEVATGLAGMDAVRGRLVVRRGRGGSRIIDDSYNANPASLRAALHVLGRAEGRRWLVLGDMGELGPEAAAIHRTMGREARELGVAQVFALGELTRETVEGFGPGARHFTDVTLLTESLSQDLAPDVTVLVKGSRFMQLERVVASLVAEDALPC